MTDGVGTPRPAWGGATAVHPGERCRDRTVGRGGSRSGGGGAHLAEGATHPAALAGTRRTSEAEPGDSSDPERGDRLMLALGIRYLTGYAVATDPANRSRSEWPPHPGRVFMALAAAHFETGEDPVEREALEWLESQPAPYLTAEEADERSVVTHYVPVNDKAGPARGILQSVPGLTRGKQPRTYPRVRPHDETVWLIWPDADPPGELRQALAGLCEKVTYLGHSSSLVQFWVSENGAVPAPDRKSTRLNSSHVAISYAVFCSKKKQKPYHRHLRLPYSRGSRCSGRPGTSPGSTAGPADSPEKSSREPRHS